MGIYVPTIMRGKTSKRTSKAQGKRRKSDATTQKVTVEYREPSGSLIVCKDVTIPIPTERMYKGPISDNPATPQRTLISASTLAEANKIRKGLKQEPCDRATQQAIDRLYSEPIPNLKLMTVQERIAEIKAERTAANRANRIARQQRRAEHERRITARNAINNLA